MKQNSSEIARVGDIVHYRVPHDPGDWECIAGTCRAAIVTSVNPANPEFLSLRVFTLSGEFIVASVQMDDCPKSWHWRDRCDAPSATQALVNSIARNAAAQSRIRADTSFQAGPGREETGS